MKFWDLAFNHPTFKLLKNIFTFRHRAYCICRTKKKYRVMRIQAALWLWCNDCSCSYQGELVARQSIEDSNRSKNPLYEGAAEVGKAHYYLLLLKEASFYCCCWGTWTWSSAGTVNFPVLLRLPFSTKNFQKAKMSWKDGVRLEQRHHNPLPPLLLDKITSFVSKQYL